MTVDDRGAAGTTELEANKAVVAQAIARIINAGDLDAADELYVPGVAADMKAWVAPFRASFPDVEMTTVALIAEGNTVVGHFRCSGTHVGRWLGREPTGRRFQDVDEVYWFTIVAGRIAAWWGLEDNQARLRQLGLVRTS
jgi:predicted ester cyclase